MNTDLTLSIVNSLIQNNSQGTNIYTFLIVALVFMVFYKVKKNK